MHYRGSKGVFEDILESFRGYLVDSEDLTGAFSGVLENLKCVTESLREF